MVSISITDMPDYRPINRKPKPTYMAFSLPCDETTAALRFKARYGYLPEFKQVVPNNLLLGPVLEIDLGEGE